MSMAAFGGKEARGKPPSNTENFSFPWIIAFLLYNFVRTSERVVFLKVIAIKNNCVLISEKKIRR